MQAVRHGGFDESNTYLQSMYNCLFSVLNRQWSGWSAWSKCSQSSGAEGVCVRQRVCLGPESGGPACGTDLGGPIQTQKCGPTTNNTCSEGEGRDVLRKPKSNINSFYKRMSYCTKCQVHLGFSWSCVNCIYRS